MIVWRRMRLARDTGMIQLDENGFWIDVPIVADEEEIPAPEEAIPPPVPQSWFERAFEGEPIPREAIAPDPEIIQTSASEQVDGHAADAERFDR